MSDSAYTIKPFPAFRQFVIDGLELASRKHMIRNHAAPPPSRTKRKDGRDLFLYSLRHLLLCKGGG